MQAQTAIKTIIKSVEIQKLGIPTKVTAEAVSLLLKNTLKDTLFLLDTKDRLLEQLRLLGFTPQAMENDNSSLFQAYLLTDPNLGKVILYLNEINVSIH